MVHMYAIVDIVDQKFTRLGYCNTDTHQTLRSRSGTSYIPSVLSQTSSVPSDVSLSPPVAPNVA